MADCYNHPCDTAVMAIENHFIQKDFGIYAKLENLLLQAAKKENCERGNGVL